ncbi:gpn-loop gtpase 3 like protein [Moesziomyces aphidis]|uniref:GPN-loop GTPase 3 n=3 Tax=Moesziomyces TaxID=63261 RepID=A0A081CBB8_PSEA2|nr:GPN-loop GTPase 3 like protein [Moesziomyces antarcticus]ETS60924.1 gpn-loop gtpase 3 like protein [Moesziomyces aphidis]GAK63964.1 GPN-loop GTPase 3 like protein [Moesziomyces antarcticus]SPO44825.1 GPN-loop GTPase 3 homolog UM01243 [Moesziomyces antarcticus]
MGRYAVLVSGPAGSGKSTFCSALIAHAQSLGRNVHLFNLDPAAERFEYQPSIDIKELISLEDVMEEMNLGPNGGLIYCFEYLLDNLDWLDDELGEFNDDYIIIDCPGQIELYTHFPIMSRLVNILSVQYNFRICATYLLEAQFMDDKTKYFAGVLSAMSAMINLEVPHINLLSKMDLVEKGEIGAEAKKGRRREMERYLDPDPLLLMDEVNSRTNPKFHSLNQALVQLIDDFSMVSFMPLDSTDEDSVGTILSHIDNAVQYGEDEEPKEPKDMDEGDFQAA